jgi:antitoxin component YwqK of YwqJK toxin-antitoxin module
LDEQYQKYMKKNICEYYPNGKLKHKIQFYPNGSKCSEQYYGQDGKDHRNKCLPDFQKWRENGYLQRQTFYTHGSEHNISNPADIWFNENGKIEDKFYYINDCYYDNKLDWNNCIKNII